MYCKYNSISFSFNSLTVLIVAKCIVNEEGKILTVREIEVLIVAKCIVNISLTTSFSALFLVLIVAKCIVNSGESSIAVTVSPY